MERYGANWADLSSSSPFVSFRASYLSPLVHKYRRSSEIQLILYCIIKQKIEKYKKLKLSQKKAFKNISGFAIFSLSDLDHLSQLPSDFFPL